MTYNVKSYANSAVNTCVHAYKNTHTDTFRSQVPDDYECPHTKPIAMARAYQIKEEIKKCLRTQMYPLLHYFNFLSVWSVAALTGQFILFQIFFWFYFSYVQMMGRERLFFLLHASKLYKEVFDLRNPICISSIVSSSYCGILKVRSERPFDNYRKTFWLYYTAFHLLSCRG